MERMPDRAPLSVTVRFYEELNDFLPPRMRGRPSTVTCAEGSTTKALIEDLGVPHTEVDLILANGESVDFHYRLSDGDMLSVYPMFESWDITGLSRVRPQPLRVPRFALDVHLGKLARLLRMMGFDAAYDNAAEDEALVAQARRENRTVLTRDRGILKRRRVTHGYYVRSLEPLEQLTEVMRRFDLGPLATPFARCMRCNVPLERIDVEEARPAVPPVVAKIYHEFSRCPSCGRAFWRGTHWERMKKITAAALLSDRGGSTESV
ncbi:MAG TPA: Mut7-C RNAse domain-containing protein [Spirochaetia bacterium]